MANDRLKDSCTYREIYRKGFFQGAAKVYCERPPESSDEVRLKCHQLWLSELAEEWLGLPSAEIRAKINAIDDVPTLEKLVENLTNRRLKIVSWDELFAPLEFPSTRRAGLR